VKRESATRLPPCPEEAMDVDEAAPVEDGARARVRSPPALRVKGGKRKRSLAEAERLPFTAAEEAALHDGVRAFGADNWVAILCGGGFDPRRTSGDLEEKWRMICAAADEDAAAPPCGAALRRGRALLLHSFNSASAGALRGRQLQQAPAAPTPQQPPPPPQQQQPVEEEANADVVRGLIEAAEALESLA